jgi:hypothetical protein
MNPIYAGLYTNRRILSFTHWIFYINLVETDGRGGIQTDMRVPAAGLVSSAGGTNGVNTAFTTLMILRSCSSGFVNPSREYVLCCFPVLTCQCYNVQS